MFKNDERYWDINLLNKWFAISSIVFLVVMVWIFIDDNDDEFKDYQREFRKLEIEKTKEKLRNEEIHRVRRRARPCPDGVPRGVEWATRRREVRAF